MEDAPRKSSRESKPCIHEGYVDPPSSESSLDRSYQADESNYDSSEETDEMPIDISISSDPSEEEEEEEEETTPMIHLTVTDEMITQFVTIAEYFKNRNMTLKYLCQFPIGTVIRKIQPPFGDDDLLKDTVFILYDQIITINNEVLYLIVMNKRSRQKYCLDKPFFLDWISV
jgi:hypothetical protein